MVIKLPDTIIYIKNCSATRVFNIGHRKMKNSISQSLGAIFHSKQKLICLKKKMIKNRSRVNMCMRTMLTVLKYNVFVVRTDSFV
jgi:hypothetical protein